ncbi:MAG TPA: hypothetical protein VD769_02935 [Gaiellaceae bacterium]|nr:hypothetical protein [Gaiellaceae bacterium]
MRHEAATVLELSRAAELSVLPGETLTRLAREMERHELGPGQELDAGELYAVVLSGLVSGEAGVLHPGDRAEGRVRAVMPSAVASCTQDVYDRVVAGA